MKKYLAAVAVGVALLVSGCGGAASTVTVTATAPASPTTPVEPIAPDLDYIFLKTVKESGIPWLMQANDQDLLGLAYEVCEILNSGTTINELIAALAQGFAENGQTNDPDLYRGTGFLIGAAVAAYCPQHSN